MTNQDQDQKPYAALAPALRALFGGRTLRLPLDAGFTCPNRDGRVGRGGCSFCDAGGSRAAHAEPSLAVGEQVRAGIAHALARAASRPPETFIAYFQAFSNTYGPPERLAALYREALDADERVRALAVATRPDCLPEPALDVLQEMHGRTFLWVELGLQSTRDETLRAVNRGHGVAAFRDAAERLRARGLRFLGHAVFGLPGDAREDMLAVAPLLNESGAWGVKLHNLVVDRRAPLAGAWRAGRVATLEREAYRDLVIDCLRRLDPRVLIHRLVGEAPRERLLSPAWCADKRSFLNDLEREMRRRGVRQGDLLQPESARAIPR